MKRWIIYAILAGFGLLIIGVILFLYFQGYLKAITWQGITITFAAASGPAKMIYDKLSTDDDPNDGIDNSILGKLKDKFAEIQQEQQQSSERFSEKEMRIALLDKELQAIELKIDLLKERKSHLETEVNYLDEKMANNINDKPKK